MIAERLLNLDPKGRIFKYETTQFVNLISISHS